MSEEKGNNHYLGYSSIICFMILLYFLSIGPVAFIYPKGPTKFLLIFYKPHFFLFENIPLFRKPIESYIKFWIDL